MSYTVMSLELNIATDTQVEFNRNLWNKRKRKEVRSERKYIPKLDL